MLSASIRPVTIPAGHVSYLFGRKRTDTTMGLNAGLYIIPATKFAAAQAKGTWHRHRWDKCRPWFDLDKAWWQFDPVLKRRSIPLGYAIAGNIRLSPNEPGFNLVSPDVVAQIARELADTPTEGVVAEIERD